MTDPKRLAERLESQISPEPNSGCWLWTGRVTRRYGTVWDGQAQVPAHRATYSLIKGPIPAGLVIDHLCRNRICVNPDHLEPVTNKENVLRGTGISAANARKTHCKNGHELSGDNLVQWKLKRGMRECRACRNTMPSALARLKKPRAIASAALNPEVKP